MKIAESQIETAYQVAKRFYDSAGAIRITDARNELAEAGINPKLWSALYKENIKYLTVHDAILIDPKDLIVAKSHFERILKEEFGYLPKVKITQLSPKKAIEESEKKKEQFDEAA